MYRFIDEIDEADRLVIVYRIEHRATATGRADRNPLGDSASQRAARRAVPAKSHTIDTMQAIRQSRSTRKVGTVLDRHVCERPPAPGLQRSDDLDGNCIGVGSERSDVGSVAGQDRPAGLRDCDNECVDS